MERISRFSKVPVPLTEFLLGLADIAGEVMRYTINSVSAGHLDVPTRSVHFLRCLHEGDPLPSSTATQRALVLSG